MKKILLATLLLVGLTLAACQSDEDNTGKEDNEASDNTTQTGQNADTENNTNTNDQTADTEENADNEDTNANNDENNSDEGENGEVEQTEEYDTIASEVDLDGQTPEIVEDNQNKRVILFRDADDRESYKSIFIKNEKRLKVIDIEDDEGQVYNDIID